MIPRSRRRLFGLYALTVAAVVVLGGRLWYLQVLDTTQYKALAQVNQTRQIVVPAVRGGITDDTGTPFVRNETEMVVSVNMLDLSQHTTDNGAAVLKRLAPLLHLSDKTLTEKVRLCTRACPSRAGPGRRTSRSRWRRTSATRPRCRSWRSRRSSSASPRRSSR